MTNNILSQKNSLKTKGKLISEFKMDSFKNFNPIVGNPYNIDKVTIEQIDNLNITYILTTGRSASTLLGVMLMMNEKVIFTSEEIFPVILKQKYAKLKKWTEKDIEEYCNDFVLMSEGKLYPLFCGKDVLKKLLLQFKEHLNYERVIRISYLSFGINKDLSKITTIVDKQLRYYLAHQYLQLFPKAKIILLVRDPRDNVYSRHHWDLRKGILDNDCMHIHKWKRTFQTYLKLIQQHSNPYIIVHYEQLINESETTMQQISNFIGIPYTHNYFKYPEIVQQFFNQISHPKLSKYFFITHRSLNQPITPQKVNEWKNQMHQQNIAHIINATWSSTKKIAEKLNYIQHSDYVPTRVYCLKAIIKTKMNLISSYFYFEYLPYFIKKIIKQIKHPYRITASSTYDKLL